MEPTSYSIYFTGRFLQSLPHETQWSHLRKLFPHASEQELIEFFVGKRLLLTHTDAREVATELVIALADHGLECEVVSNAPPPPDVNPRAVLIRPHAKLVHPLLSPKTEAATSPEAAATVADAAPQAPAPVLTVMPAVDEDALTPKGRRWLMLAAALAGAITLYAVWSSVHSTYGRPSLGEDGAAIPSICAVNESPNWFSGNGNYSLACSAQTAGGRYKLLLRCHGPTKIEATLAFFDLTGSPRIPQWLPASAAAPAHLPLRYQLADRRTWDIDLQATSQPNVGSLTGLDGYAATELLANSSAAFTGIGSNDTVVFQFEPARWYINSFLYGCQLSKPPVS